MPEPSIVLFSAHRGPQFATALITDVRRNEAKTPFLRHALTEIDGFLGRPLTDGELAEESMGGMYGSITLASRKSLTPWLPGSEAVGPRPIPFSTLCGPWPATPPSRRNFRTSCAGRFPCPRGCRLRR